MFLLDTNIVSYIARNRSPAARQRLIAAQRIEKVCVSAITEGEVLYGLARRPEARQVAYFMHATLVGLRVLPWASKVAQSYGRLRAQNERSGISFGELDLLIAAHALAEGAVLVTNDPGLMRLIGGPETVNWADDLQTE